MPQSFRKVMRKNWQSILTVSSSTLGSRVFGFLRDILVYAQLGLSQTNSAFLLAFTLPNLFRRLFGEGALGSALIPVFTEENARGGAKPAFALLNRTLSRALLLLLTLTLVCGLLLALPLFAGAIDETRYGEAARLGLMLFPYVVPICLAALLAGALQVLGRFFTPAITPVVLNLCMIAFLGGPGIWFGETTYEKALWLSLGVLAGGLLQFLLPAVDLWYRGWRPRFDFSGDPALGKLQRLFVPAIAGAAILQVNILVSRSLAFFVDDDGVALLYLAARLVELPLGIFGIAAATVLFPEFARHFSAGNRTAFRDSYRSGSALVAAVTLPAFIGLAVLGDPILRAVFAWGLFDPEDAARAAPVLALFAAGLPFYAQATLLTKAHQARQDMKTPVRVAGWVLLANLGLSLALMGPFRRPRTRGGQHPGGGPAGPPPPPEHRTDGRTPPLLASDRPLEGSLRGRRSPGGAPSVAGRGPLRPEGRARASPSLGHSRRSRCLRGGASAPAFPAAGRSFFPEAAQ